MIFPQIAPELYDQRGHTILSRMTAVYSENITINQSFWSESDLDHRFYSGDQTVWNDLYGNLPVTRRQQFSFNRIRRVINMIEGHQRRNRKSTIVIPVENGDQETADQFTKILSWVNRQEGVLETISDSFRGSLICGMNLLQVWVDYRSDPVNGDIKVDNCSYNTFLIDPYFKKADLSDCNNIWTRKFLDRRACVSYFPDKADEIMGLVTGSNGTGRDGRFQFSPESFNYGNKDLLTYDEFYYRDYRKQRILVDAQTGETMEWRSNNEEGLREFLLRYPQVTVSEVEIPTVKLAIVIEGRVMYDGPQPNGLDIYPFVPVFAYYQPEIPYFPWRIQGVVRGLRDSQYLYNRRKVIELDILESQVNSGFIVKENALVNPKDLFLSGQGRPIVLKEEAQITDIQQIVAPQVPPSMIELSRILAEEITQISGVNEELLGSAMDDKAGVLSMLRQGAGLTTLQNLFDNLDHAQKLLGRIMIDLIQTNWTPGKIKKILEGKEPAPQFYNKAFGKYHSAVEEGLNTTTQKQMEFAQLLQLREIGVPIPNKTLLEACTLQNKKQLIDDIMQSEQQQAQQAQAQQQAQVQQVMAQTELAQARAVADKGLGLERISRVEENHALAEERRAEAEKEKDLALLNMVKALKEIEGIDLAHVEKLLALSKIVKESQEEAVQEEPSQVNVNETIAPTPQSAV